MNKNKYRGVLRNRKQTNKRKAEDNAKPEKKRQSVEVIDLVDESDSENTDKSDSGSEDCNSFVKQKSDNSGGSEKPVSSEDANSTEDNCKSSDGTKEHGNFSKSNFSDKSGVLLFSGGTNWDIIGRKDVPKNAKKASGGNLWGPHRLSALKGIRIAFVASGNLACHSVIGTAEGRTMTWGRNEKAQLGHNDTVRRNRPVFVKALKECFIIGAACGRSHTLFLSDKGTVYSCGDNEKGQCGVESRDDTIMIPTKITFKPSRPVSKVSCGGEFSAIVDSDGGLYTFGCTEYGQLGHYTDGKCFDPKKKRCKFSFSCEPVPRRVIGFIEKTVEGRASIVEDVKIVEVACGVNHSVALDTKKRCFTWGFGGYGRLGHACTEDEFAPRLIKSQYFNASHGVKHVFAGRAYCMAVDERDVLFFWGQTNASHGEATMYPKPVQDLTGWKVHQVACSSSSIVVVADDSVIAWGTGTTFGELCYGEDGPKSSVAPKVAKPLDGLHILDIACGRGHTLLIARDESEEDSAKLNALPVFTPE